MGTIKSEYLQESYIGRKTAEELDVDYDENQLLAASFFSFIRKQRREERAYVK